MLEIGFSCGEWCFMEDSRWEFVFNNERGSSFDMIFEDITFEDLVSLVYEDFSVDRTMYDAIISHTLYKFPSDRSPPSYIRNDRQFKSIILKSQDLGEQINLYVTFRHRTETAINCIANSQEHMVMIHNVNTTQPMARETEQLSIPVVIDNNNADNHNVPFIAEGWTNVENMNYNDEDGIFVGKFFRTKHELMKQIRVYAMKESFEFRTRLSDGRRVVLDCVDDKCDWRFTAYRVDKTSEGFIIQHYEKEHTCDTSHRNLNHRQATAKILGEMISSHYGEGKAGLKPKQIIEMIRKDHGININYSKAYKAQCYAEALVRGSPDDSYQLLPKWFYVLREKNPGSIPYLHIDPNNKFKYAFLSFGASIRGFKLLRKVIAVDGAFLKSKFRGTLLGATAQDGNFQLFPIAFGIVDSENDDSWAWFFTCLKSIVPDEKDLVFVSDRAKSIAKGLSAAYPLAHHGICTFHFERNITTHFKSTPVMPLIQDAARVYTQGEFDLLFDEIRNFNSKLADYLVDADISKWSRAYSPVNRYNIMTTNIAESLNAMLSQSREYPIVFLLETIRVTLTRWFHDRHQKALQHKHPLTPAVGRIMREVYESSRFLEVCQVNEDVFEVKGDLRKHLVNLRNKNCTCRKFEIDGYPCNHAFAAVKRTNISETSLVTDFYTNERLIQLYAESIYPVGDEDSWDVPREIDELVCLPPTTRIPSGRRRKKRINSSWEHGAKRRLYKCKRCGKAGHSKSRCISAI